MKIRLLIILSVLFLAFSSNSAHGGGRLKTGFSIDAGYRTDSIDWNIAGNINGGSPNILSELTWEGLDIFQLKATGRVLIYRGLLLRGSFGYGWIYDGSNRDSDYSGDDRTLEFSRSVNNSDDGRVLDASIGLGYMFIFRDRYGIIAITPLAGYSQSEQNLTITDGFQVIPPTGAFPGLDSTYDTRWRGPWAGVEVLFEFTESSLTALFEYHLADYYAEADWNLRTDFAHPKSFEHEADGSGIVLALDWNYDFSERFSIKAGIDYQRWSTEHGIDRTFFATGAIVETRLNEVNWRSTTLSAGIVLRL